MIYYYKNIENIINSNEKTIINQDLFEVVKKQTNFCNILFLYDCWLAFDKAGSGSLK